MTSDELRSLCRALVIGMPYQEKVEFIIGVTADTLITGFSDTVPIRSNEAEPKKKAKKDPNPSRILAKKGDQCVCSECRKVAYTVLDNVYAEGMSGEEFIACFSPSPPVPVDMLTDVHGNECVDCPLCKGDKTVTFLRRS